jgi:hypothetical protein
MIGGPALYAVAGVWTSRRIEHGRLQSHTPSTERMHLRLSALHQR